MPELVRASTSDRVTLALRHFAARGARRGVCLCTHAMMANARYFAAGRDDGFAGHLARAGIDVFVLDWRGHGESQRRTETAHAAWCFDDHVERDLPAAIAAVCSAAGIAAGELFYVGHSLGGVAGLAAIGTGAIAQPRALALFATSLWLPGPRGLRVRRWIMRFYDLASRPLGYAPVRLLRLGSEDEPRGYVEQLTGWARTGQWRSKRGVDYLASLARIDAPVWAASGDGDRLCVPRDAEVMLSRLRGARPLRRVGTRQGDALDADHFTLFTRPALAPLWDELIAFLLAARSSRVRSAPVTAW